MRGSVSSLLLLLLLLAMLVSLWCVSWHSGAHAWTDSVDPSRLITNVYAPGADVTIEAKENWDGYVDDMDEDDYYPDEAQEEPVEEEEQEEDALEVGEEEG